MEKYSDKEILDGLKNRQRNVVLFVTEEYLPMINYLVGRMGEFISPGLGGGETEG